MASWQLQNDKANAMRRFKRKRNVETIFHLFNVCAAILLFSHYSSFIPIITLQTFSHLYHLLLPLFRNSFYAFLLLNAIILFLFLLSNKHNNNNNNNVAVFQDVVYHEILNHSQSCLILTAPLEQSSTVDFSHRKTPISDSQVEDSRVFEEPVTAVTETTTTERDTVSEKSHRRVQSDSYERRMVVAPPRGELKRCNTTQLKKPLQRQLRCVEQLSEDEFNRAVEEFIVMHKRMQWEEQIESQKKDVWSALPEIK